eukprot:gene23759-32145_t
MGCCCCCCGSSASAGSYSNPKYTALAEEYRVLELSENELNTFGKLFRRIDLDDSGTISIEELMTALGMDTVFQKRIFGMFDTDGSGKISFAEMVFAFWDFCTLSSISFAAFAFSLYDFDRSGSLSAKEVKQVLVDVYGEDRRSNSVLKSALENVKGNQMDLNAFHSFTKSHQDILLPVFQVQLGTKNWERKTSSRDMHSRGEYIPVQDYINKRLNRTAEKKTKLRKKKRHASTKNSDMHEDHGSHRKVAVQDARMHYNDDDPYDRNLSPKNKTCSLLRKICTGYFAVIPTIMIPANQTVNAFRPDNDEASGGEDTIDEDLIFTDRESYYSEPAVSEVLDESIAVVDDNLYALRLKVKTLSTQLGQSGFIIDESMFKLDDDLSSNFSSHHGDSEGGMDSAVDKYLKSHQHMLFNSHKPEDAPIPEQLIVPPVDGKETHHSTYIVLPSQRNQVEANIPEHLIQPHEEEGTRHTYISSPPLQIDTNIPEHLTRDRATRHTYTTDSHHVLDTHISDHITTTISSPLVAKTKTLKTTTISDVSEMVEMMMVVSSKTAQGDADAFDLEYQDDLDYIDFLSSHGNLSHHIDGVDSILAADIEEDEYEEDFLPDDNKAYDPAKLSIIKKSIKERRVNKVNYTANDVSIEVAENVSKFQPTPPQHHPPPPAIRADSLEKAKIAQQQQSAQTNPVIVSTYQLVQVAPALPKLMNIPQHANNGNSRNVAHPQSKENKVAPVINVRRVSGGHDLRNRNTADGLVRARNDAKASLETSRSLPTNQHKKDDAPPSVEPNSNPNRYPNPNPPPKSRNETSDNNVRNKGRKLVAGDGRAFVAEKSHENSASNSPKAPPVKDIGPSNITQISNKPTNVKMSLIAAYLTPLKNMGQFAAGGTTEKKTPKQQKAKKASRVWIEDPKYKYDDATGLFSSFEIEELEYKSYYMKLSKREKKPRPPVFARPKRENGVESIPEEKEQENNEISSPPVAVAVAVASDTAVNNVSASLEFTAGSDTVFPHLQATITHTPHSKTTTTPDRRRQSPLHGSTSRNRLEQTTESLSYSPDVVIATPREEEQHTFRPITEPNDNEYSGDYGDDFDGVVEDNHNLSSKNTAHDDNHDNNNQGRVEEEEAIPTDGGNDNVDDDHDMYRDFTPSPASATVEVVTAYGDDGDQAGSDDDMYNYAWDGEVQDSPVHSPSLNKNRGNREQVSLGPTISAESPSHHAATRVDDDMFVSEEQMMMELPSLLRRDADLQGGDEEDEYYNDYNEFNKTDNSNAAAVLDHDSIYDLDPFD